MRNCDLAGRAFFVQTGAPAASSIDVDDGSGQYLLTALPASSASRFVAEWNAYRTDGMAAPQRVRR